MTTETFCNELPPGLTQEQIDGRINELKTVGGALDAFTKQVGAKLYICAVREVFGEPLDDMVFDPERAGPAAVPPERAGSAAVSGDAQSPLADADYRRAAAELGCEPAAIRAVAEVESGGRSGFLADGRPKILFESRIFSRETGGRFDSSHPDLSTPRWVRNYQGGEAEHDRLEQAMQLDREAALRSASWGRFQIMGFNHDRCGFASVSDFVEAQKRSEQEHLEAFVRFILSRGLSDELRQRRWDKFAEGYNGPKYRENRWDEKMAAAYARYAGPTA